MWRFRTRLLHSPKGLTLTGTSQGSAHPENDSTVHKTTCLGASFEVGDTDTHLPRPFTDGEWEAIVAAAVAAVAQIEAAQQPTDTTNDPTEDTIIELLENQPTGSRAFSLPIAPGASAPLTTWHNRRYWLSLCEWIVTHTDRGRAALKRHGIAAGTFLRGCTVHAQFAESTTGRRVTASLNTLVDRSGLSIDQIKRCRRVLKTLELGIEQARGKKLNALEREAAARHYEQVHGQAPTRPQRGAASVWALSAPRWAVEAMPVPNKKTTTQCRPRRRPPRPSHAAPTTAPRPRSLAPRKPRTPAPQSPSGSSLKNLSVRKDHPTRERARKKFTSTTTRPLALQRAAAELIERIPALRGFVGIDDLTGCRRGHIGSICDLLVKAGINTERWTGIDIAQALTLDGITRGWTWPTTDSMTSPMGLVAYRLNQLDWSGPSPTERKVHNRQLPTETPASAAYRLVKARRNELAATETEHIRPASAEHRQALRAEFSATLAAKKKFTNHARSTASENIPSSLLKGTFPVPETRSVNRARSLTQHHSVPTLSKNSSSTETSRRTARCT